MYSFVCGLIILGAYLVSVLARRYRPGWLKRRSVPSDRERVLNVLMVAVGMLTLVAGLDQVL